MINLDEIEEMKKALSMRSQKTSMTYWFPLIKNLGIPIPKTVIINLRKTALTEEDIHDVIEEHVEEIKKAIWEVKRNNQVFIRTDLMSAKHSFEKSCYLKLPKTEFELWKHLYEIIVAGLIADIVGYISRAIVVREYIEPKWAFKAFCGLPIGMERRYFIKDGKFLCNHPYWEEGAIEFYGKTMIEDGKLKSIKEEPEEWKEKLRELNEQDKEEISLLSSYVEMIINAGFTQFWSIDFMKGKDGKWYLIDMAEGNESWHPDCRYKLECGDQKRKP